MSLRRALYAFAAGFLATLFFHQPTLWILKLLGITTRSPYNMSPTWPLGVPSVISLAFWGGVWGIAMIAAIARLRGAYYPLAMVFGALLPTAVAVLVVAPLKGAPITGDRTKLLILGLSVNAMWGLGTALFYRLFTRGGR